MSELKISSGSVFGKLTVTAYDEAKRGKGRHWLCNCDCGQKRSVRETRLLSGEARGCGCGRSTHGQHGTRTYQIWHGVMSRCLNPNTENYKRYGVRGITIAQEWRTFEGFFAAMGECPDGLTIERIDGSLGYQAGNCVWASTKVQARNRSNNVRIRIGDEEMVLADWCARFDRRYKVVCNRIYSGWSVELALATPTNEGFTNCQK